MVTRSMALANSKMPSLWSSWAMRIHLQKGIKGPKSSRYSPQAFRPQYTTANTIIKCEQRWKFRHHKVKTIPSFRSQSRRLYNCHQSMLALPVIELQATEMSKVHLQEQCNNQNRLGQIAPSKVFPSGQDSKHDRPRWSATG